MVDDPDKNEGAENQTATQEAPKDATPHVELLQENVSAVNDTVNGIADKIGDLKDQHPGEIVELDKQVSQAHGILNAVHYRVKHLLGLNDEAEKTA